LTRGFTLLELLVAISILALIAVIAWRGLSSLATTRERLEPQTDQIRSVLAGFGQIERDLQQSPTSPRLFALPMQAVRLVTIEGRDMLQILRLTESPDGSNATAVQTVLYQVREGALQRQTTAAQRFYSAEQASQMDTVALVPGIDAMQVRVWRVGVGWVVPTSDSDTANAPGIEVQLLRHDGSVMRRVFAVG
jgi:general secretion pathway protein J